MGTVEATDSPSGEVLARSILTSFAAALQRFDETWHAGWYAPANERACVAKVAVDITSKFGTVIEPWCEVSLGVLCGSKNLESPKIENKGAVDLVLTTRSGGKTLALIEFKTHESIEDVEKLETLQNYLDIPIIMVIACHGVRFSLDRERTIGKLEEYIQSSLTKTPGGWQSAINTDISHIEISGLDRGVWRVRPFVLWRQLRNA